MKIRFTLSMTATLLVGFLFAIVSVGSVVAATPSEIAGGLQVKLEELDISINQVRVVDNNPVHLELVLNRLGTEIGFEDQWAILLAEYETYISLDPLLNGEESESDLLAMYDLVIVDSKGVEVERSTDFIYADSMEASKRSTGIKINNSAETQQILQNRFSLESMQLSSNISAASIAVEADSRMSGNPTFVNMDWVTTKDTDLLDVFRHFGEVFKNEYASLDVDFVRVHVVDGQGEWLADYGADLNLGSATFRLSEELSNLSTPPMPPEEYPTEIEGLPPLEIDLEVEGISLEQAPAGVERSPITTSVGLFGMVQNSPVPYVLILLSTILLIASFIFVKRYRS